MNQNVAKITREIQEKNLGNTTFICLVFFSEAAVSELRDDEHERALRQAQSNLCTLLEQYPD
jgi:hypothetical protein